MSVPLPVLLLRSLGLCALVLLAAVPSCDEGGPTGKVVFDLRAEQGLPPIDPPPPTPEEMADLRARQERKMQDDTRLMRDYTEVLIGITDLTSLEESRPRVEQLAVQMRESLEVGEELGEVLPEVKAEYGAEHATAKQAMDEAIVAIQKNVAVFAALQEMLRPILDPKAKQGAARPATARPDLPRDG